MRHASAATTLKVWGAIVILNALGWLLAPDAYLKQMSRVGVAPGDFGAAVGVRRDDDAWLKLFACTALVLGYYYVDAGVHNDRRFAERSVKGRVLILILVLAFQAPRGMIALGLADAVGAFWTWRALLNRR